MDKTRKEHEEIAGKLGLSGYWLYVFPDECPHCGAPLWAKYSEKIAGIICEYCGGEVLGE